jgi:hypothetical protein
MLLLPTVQYVGCMVGEKKKKREKIRWERKKIFGEPVKERSRFGEGGGREKKSSVLCFSLSLCIFFFFC